ncbi:phage tail spike protein [Schinkia azotoformans]|uniref:phage tail spike protein n=1 Tax=Schinkia azotoformans TaxID=1454 RepID=UPI002DBE0FF1|nr:phage tail spike protein [Schinkia azotoformans]MEC1780081.1 phage tail spike protein [Schinkia azotoformans]MED4330840.1 phage tail spike protein [Schinkia azotoformans]
MFGSIINGTTPEKSRLYLCKPNKETIAELSEAYNKKVITSSNGIHELSFNVPYVIERNQEFIRNPNIDKIRGNFLIRYEKGNEKEYFIISKPKNAANNGHELKQVHCFLLPIELNKKTIRDYKVTKQLYDFAGTDGILNETLLTKTDWSIGYINTDIAFKVRSVDASEKNLIEFIGDICKWFDCVPIWDTQNKKLSLYKEDELGVDRGLSIEYGKYLKNIEEEPDFDNLVTRLILIGKDGLTVNSVNPSQESFIESFDYYLYPFERDLNRNVIKHSNYMSDDLAHAILDYQALLESKQPTFDSLLNEKENLESQLKTKNEELKLLNDQLLIILNDIDRYNSKNQDATQLMTDKSNKENEIGAKQLEIDEINESLTINESNLLLIRNEIAIENNFTEDQIIERNYYINEKIWSNDSIFDAKELLEAGYKQLEKMKEPIVSYSIDIVDFLKVAECHRDWDKLNQFDIVTIKYPNFNINIKAKIIEIEHDEDGNIINLGIANARDLNSGFITYTEMMKSFKSSSRSVDMSKYKWDKSEENQHEISKILNENWDAAKREIKAGVSETVTINSRGITIEDETDPLRFLRMTNSVIGMTNNGGVDYKTAITPEGVNASVIIGSLLMGEKLVIGNADGTFLIDGNKLTIKDRNAIVRTLLGEYEPNKFGIKLLDKTGNQTILSEDGLLQVYSDGRTDNVDANNPLILNVYIPANTKSIIEGILRFKLLPFRAYSKGTASGGGQTVTSSAGGGFYESTSSGGGEYSTLSTTTQTEIGKGYKSNFGTDTANDHNHGVPDGTQLLKAGGGSVTFYASGMHSHYNYAHDHEVEVEINIAPHTHVLQTGDHQHNLTLYPHEHSIQYGIFQSSVASGVTCTINGIDRTTALGGKFYGDRSNLDIRPYLNIGQWNEIKLGSNQLGRIDATVFLQSFMGI